MTARDTILALALSFIILGLLLVMTCSNSPLPWDPIQPDSSSYYTLAQGLASQGVFSVQNGQPSAKRELLYPAFLSLFIKSGLVDGNNLNISNLVPVFTAQALLYFIALYLLAWFSRAANLTTHPGLIPIVGTLYLPISQYAFQLLSETLTIFLTTLFFASLYWWEQQGKNWRLGFTALILGLLTMVKSIMALVPAALVLLFLKRKKFNYSTAIVFLSLSLLPCTIWTVRNYVHFDTIIIGTTDGASSLYRGNMLLGEQPPSMSDPRIPLAVKKQLNTLPAESQNTYLLNQVKQRLMDHPTEFSLHLLFKAFNLIIGNPQTPMHWLLIASRIVFIALIVSSIPRIMRHNETTVQMALVFSFVIAVSYTLIYTTPRYFIPAWFILLPIACEEAGNRVNRFRLPKM